MSFARLSLAAAFLAISLPALAASETVPTISVQATGTSSVEPDIATVQLTVLREAKTARAALSANTEAMQQVLDAMKAAGIAEKDLQTSNFSIQPQWFYPRQKTNGQQDEPRITGYQVSNALTVRIRDLSSLGEVLDQAVTLGVNSGGNIVFSSSKADEARQEARADAMKRAIDKARVLTDAAGASLGRILKISEQGGRIAPRPIARAARLEMAADSAPVPVAAGESTYRVTVSVSWEIAQ